MGSDAPSSIYRVNSENCPGNPTQSPVRVLSVSFSHDQFTLDFARIRYSRMSTDCTASMLVHRFNEHPVLLRKQEAQLMLTTGSTRLVVSRGQQTWYHSTCYI